jgi:periplasmic protein TonB
MRYQTYTVAKTYEGRALSLSIFLHVSVIGFYLLFLHQKPLDIIPSKMVVMEISNIERVAPKPVLPPPPEPVEEVKKVEPIKPIEKIKPLPKPIVKKEVLNPEPIREEVVQPPVEAVKPVVAPQEVAPITPTSTSAEPYERTDFEIIRDRVLARLVYPSVARRMGWNGVVQVALVISPEGRLVSATVHQSSGRAILDDAALDAALKLKGDQLPKPKSLSTVILPIAFKLK